MTELTQEQKQALDDFRAAHGAHWKSKLLNAWFTGADAREPGGGYLRQIRNQLGPQWLKNYKAE